MTIDVKKSNGPEEKEIAEYAYFLWESEGRMEGRDLDYWLQAKAHLTAARQHEAGLLNNVEGNKEAHQNSEKMRVSAPVRETLKTRKKRQTRPLQEPAYA